MASGSGVGAAARLGLPRVRTGDNAALGTAPPPVAGYTGDYPELDCVRRLLAPAALALAERRAERLGIGADRALIAARLIDEEAYLQALGRQLGIAFEPLDGSPRARCPLDDKALLGKAATGLLPFCDGDGAPVVIVVSPRGTAARGLIRLIAENPASAMRFRLTTTDRLNRFVMHAARDALIANATHDLMQRWPMLSARSRYRRRALLSMAAVLAPLLAAAILAPVAMLTTLELLLSAVFLAWLALRLTGAFIRVRLPPPRRDVPDSSLPVYTVIAALYREATSVSGLLTAIERLDYPGLR